MAVVSSVSPALLRPSSSPSSSPSCLILPYCLTESVFNNTGRPYRRNFKIGRLSTKVALDCAACPLTRCLIIGVNNIRLCDFHSELPSRRFNCCASLNTLKIAKYVSLAPRPQRVLTNKMYQPITFLYLYTSLVPIEIVY